MSEPRYPSNFGLYMHTCSASPPCLVTQKWELGSPAWLPENKFTPHYITQFVSLVFDTL